MDILKYGVLIDAYFKTTFAFKDFLNQHNIVGISVLNMLFFLKKK